MTTRDPHLNPTLNLARWRALPTWLMACGGALAVVGAVLNPGQFGYSWLLAFMFCLSLCLGALFLVLVHHLFDASWTVPLRRYCEHLAALLFPWMLLLFVPLAVLAPRLYPWMTSDPVRDHALHAKYPLFTLPSFYLVAAICFGVWALLSHRLRTWSIRQDSTGEAVCTRRMRFHAAWGIFAYALTLTLAAIMWMKALQHQWFSTMYGVYYFAGSVWMALGTIYLLAIVFRRTGILGDLIGETQFYYLGSLLFAFTVFYAYIHFSQYFIIWNANIPEETFWYVVREKGSWWGVGMVIIFGHFFLPFLTLLRIDVKEKFAIMTPVCVWTWLMHYCDLSFNVMPVKHPNGVPWAWLWLDAACLAFMVGLLAKGFLRNFAQSAPYPVRDPRLGEAMGHVDLTAVECEAQAEPSHPTYSGSPLPRKGGQ